MPALDLPIAGAHRHKQPRVVGIDLGTTNSLVAYMDGDTPRVIPDEDGRRLLPSVVCFHADGSLTVGEAAKRRLTENAARTVYSVKRLMGRGLADVEAERCFLPYRLSEQHLDVVRIEIDGRLYSPPEVSACILKDLKRRAEAHLREPITQAVITVPAYFNDSQRQATRDAGRIAGLDVLRIVNEPTAACLAYGLHRAREGTVAVYDLGGGTFDISILKLQEGIFEVVATNGDTHLGGDDMDRRLAGCVLNEIRAAEGTDFADNPAFTEEVRIAAEIAKITLTDAEEAEIHLELPNGSLYYRTLLREEFEELAAPIVAQTLEPCRRALADAGLTPEEINEVILVGGATRVPLVRRRVEELFRKRPHSELNPDEVVALGAAVQAGILSGQVQGMLLLDVNPLSLGIETVGGAVEKIIPRNSTIPTGARQRFTTAVDGQISVDIHVLQGERELAKDNRSLARFQLRGIPPMPAGLPIIEVTFLIDENGLLTVTAREVRTSTEAHIEVKPSYGLTDAEVERMILESFEHAEEDVRVRQRVEAQTEADQVLAQAEKVLPLAAEFIAQGEMMEEERERIVQALEALRNVRQAEDAAVIRATLDEVEAVSRRFAERVLNHAVREAIAGKTLMEAARE
ncbi:MAG: Fe-S protein assembly chaperone HscA [Armatimonadetes bacterium]|nr:Fe-S protein assembly chaperone HscA [Armatimonadota bacterium]